MSNAASIILAGAVLLAVIAGVAYTHRDKVTCRCEGPCIPDPCVVMWEKFGKKWDRE